ncbi:MAG: DUF6605 domain-containing protein [Candidatus Eisenbacteria bacterium]
MIASGLTAQGSLYPKSWTDLARRTTRHLFLYALALGAPLLATIAQAQNEIADENALPGSPASEWDIVGAGDASIQGFATEISVDQGETIDFKVDTDATDYRLDIYRLGYYGGLGARKVATVEPSASLPQVQPAPFEDPTTGLVDCGNWAVSASWNVPANAVSGVYVAKLVREDPEDGRASHVIFIVRDDDGGSELLFQTNDAAWQAYNTYGGNSLYTGSPDGRAYEVSYNRPFTTRCCDFPGGAIVSWFFGAQYPMVRWLERNGYDVSYTTCVDSDRSGAEILEHEVFLSVGHDEYWSGGQRANVEAAREAGVHLAFFSGNEVFWKTRWEPSIDGTSTPYRTLVCYKETHANAKIDPLPDVWTGTWRDPRFSPPADGGRPENELMGTIFTVNGIRNDALQVPEVDGKLRLWRDTSVADLAPGEVVTFGAGTLGFEWDEDLDNGFRPAGIVHFSTTTVSGVPLLQDYGSNYASGTATHHVLWRRYDDGTYVFSAGTVQWSWGLDATHDKPGPAEDPRIQQATVNLFADLGVQPTTLQAELVAATASTDATDPISVITSPAPGADVPSGVTTVVTGTASDVGGRVGGVEVSVDSGATWHPATGRESWSYTWVPGAPGTTTILSRAVDDTGNLETPGTGVTITIDGSGSGETCPCHLFAEGSGGVGANDPVSVEVGVRFRSDREGTIDGIRFFKPGVATGGTHVGRLWTNDGVLLGNVVFQDETDSGWQEALFPEGSEIEITPGTLYVASVFMPQGNYAATNGYFVNPVDNPPLHAPADGAEGFANGVYVYGTGGFPTDTFQSTNYWVDVVFDTLAVVPPCAVDQTTEDFAQGTFDSGAYLMDLGDGAVTLAPAAGAEFFGDTIPTGWSGGLWGGTGVLEVGNGILTVDGARVSSDLGFGPSRTLEFVATFGAQAFQHVGLSGDGDVNAPWALFSTGPVGGALYARTSNGTEQLIPGSWLDAPHDFVIRWQPTFFDFSIDGTPVASIPFTVGTSLRPVMSDLTVGVDSLTVDWIRLTPYATSGTFTTRVVDAGGTAAWGTFAWGADTPSGTSILMSVRTGDTAVPDGSWTSFVPIGNGGLVGQSGRYVQYRAALSTSDPATTPVLHEVTIECGVDVSGIWDAAGTSRLDDDRPLVSWPNPVTTSATFQLIVDAEEARNGRVPVDIRIYDAAGREVRTLVRGEYGSGTHSLHWNLEDGRGRRVSPGVYFYRSRIGAKERAGELIVVR